MTEIAAANFPPVAAAAGAPAAKALSVRQLTWRKFKRNRLAMVGLVVLTVMYLMAALAGFIAPYGDRETHSEFARLAPHDAQRRADLDDNARRRGEVRQGIDRHGGADLAEPCARVT